jgi:hypothetical protein
VVVTEANTQVNFTATGFGGYIYTGNANAAYLTVGTQRYPLVATYGIATNKNNCQFYSGGNQQNFTLVFEPIPKTDVLSLTWDNWLWNNIWLIDPPKPVAASGLNIPKTKGIMRIDDTFSRFDSKYKTSMTAAERTKWKTDKIHPLTSGMKIFFGKEIYKDEKCHFVTILYRMKDDDYSSATEYLVSYDSAGNIVANALVGRIEDGGYTSELTVEGDRFQYIEGDFTYYYKITPDLHFKSVEKEEFYK